MRIRPVVPWFAPHQNIREDTLKGYRVPKGTMTVFNWWAMARDPDLWDKPLEFRPERWLNEEQAVGMNQAGRHDRSSHFKFIPFSTGLRFCAGCSFADDG